MIIFILFPFLLLLVYGMLTKYASFLSANTFWFTLSIGIHGEEYRGLYLGKLNTYAHQVSGDVYAVDEYTILIKNFFYDGLGAGK